MIGCSDAREHIIG